MILLTPEVDDTAASIRATESDLWFGHESGIENEVVFLRALYNLASKMTALQWRGRTPIGSGMVFGAEPNAAALWEHVVRRTHQATTTQYLDDSQQDLDLLLKPTRERLSKLARLRADWDSYGANPVSGAAVVRTDRLLSEFVTSFGDLIGTGIRPYAVAPLANGGVQLEWRSPDGFLEVEVGPDGDLGYLLAEHQGNDRVFEEGDGVTAAEVLELAARIL